MLIWANTESGSSQVFWRKVLHSMIIVENTGTTQTIKIDLRSRALFSVISITLMTCAAEFGSTGGAAVPSTALASCFQKALYVGAGAVGKEALLMAPPSLVVDRMPRRPCISTAQKK